MIKLSILIFVLFPIFCFAVQNNEIQQIEVNKVYKIYGTLSTDLKTVPKLKTWSPNGIPIIIEAKISQSKIFDAIALRGKYVSAIIKIEKIDSLRHMKGEIIDIKLDLPTNIRDNPAKVNAKIIQPK